MSGSTLTFDSAVQFVHSVLQQSSTSGGDTIAANVFVKNDLDINNLSTSKPLTISGNIASSAAGDGFQFLVFNNGGVTGATGEIRVSGNITNGAGASRVGVSVEGGTVIFSGANTYTGGTSVSDGTLLINGTNSGFGTINVGSGGTLGGTGTVTPNVQTFGGTITGATATTVGTLTLLGNVNLATHEGSGTYLANLGGAFSDLLAITGDLILGGGSILNIQGTADGMTTYTLATFGARTSDLGPAIFETVLGIPGGYSLVYHDMDIQLVPVPEPATWVGGALGAIAVAIAQRRRRRKS